MKKLFTLITICFGGLHAPAQSFQFIETSGAPAQAVYSRQVADTAADEFVLHCVNHSGVSKNVKVRMNVLSTPDGCSNGIFFCDPIACYPPTVTESVAAFPAGAGDTVSGALIPQISQGYCCGDYAVWYCLYDVANQSDSANVMVYYTVSGNHCTNGVENPGELDEAGTAYPNPATTTFSIPYHLHDPEGATLVVYNMAGVRCAEYALTEKSATLRADAALLPQGVYFYTLLTARHHLSFNRLLIIK